ncbi:L-fuconolactonase [Draconibacterium orientale]|uniref:Amidohydrolase n=1 Tax=Draconibacterium orientale TaxID=1168034 RepID=X5DCJ7_9BACT|nr:amidohydrolase family protein [Draconibacterium orientale]AHW60563.1 amidohydrolase [Draconibacterium orientale]SET03292.1 L-fuconolactonase [Draconibacterium orientale]
MIIDTHHHLWNYNPVEFDWIDDEMAAIRKSFLPADLQATLVNTGVEGVVTVQARQSLEETDWLLKLASENDFMKGVVGWVPLADENIQQILEGCKSNPWLKGVRHVVQGEPDPEFILGKDFNKGISLLKNYNLVYDILIFEQQLTNTIRFVDQHPGQQFVVDHIAKPKIKINELAPWAKNIKELAKRENVSCKISGMVTEADYKLWTEEQLNPYFETVLEAFGPSRLLFGSDWPVCLVATNYSNWLDIVKKTISKFTKEEQDLILYKNAQRIYNI